MVGIFQPLVPAIAGAGVLKALMVLLSTLGLMSSGDIAYKVFVGVADAALYYLPVMVAFTTATKFNCNKLVSVALAAAMIHPSVPLCWLPRAVLTSSASSCRISLMADRYSRPF